MVHHPRCSVDTWHLAAARHFDLAGFDVAHRAKAEASFSGMVVSRGRARSEPMQSIVGGQSLFLVPFTPASQTSSELARSFERLLDDTFDRLAGYGVHSDAALARIACRFALPEEIDQDASQARLESGVLTLKLTKERATAVNQLAVN
jgi:hypothetical protein